MHFSWEMWIKSHFSKQEREYLSINLLCLRHEQHIEIDFLSSSEKKLMLTRIPGIKKFCWSLISAIAMSPISNSICISKHISPFPRSWNSFHKTFRSKNIFLSQELFYAIASLTRKKKENGRPRDVGAQLRTNLCHSLASLESISIIQNHSSRIQSVRPPTLYRVIFITGTPQKNSSMENLG